MTQIRAFLPLFEECFTLFFFWSLLCFQNTLETYPCGSDHTPSPMASRMPVEAETILDSPSARLTAVAVSVRGGHTIAFLGDSRGNLHKVSTVTISPHP